MTATVTAVGLDDKLAFLKRRESYPESPGAVEAWETHLAWLFLTDRCAYKLKKPVRYPFLDFRTLAARRRDAEEEVRLNRRLAAGVYLGVVALTVDEAGHLRLEGDGAPVEWLVKMRRLPRESMLDFAIASRTVDESALDGVVGLLAAFYGSAKSVVLSPGVYRRRFEHDIEANARAAAEPRYGLPSAAITATAAALRRFLQRRGDLLEARAAAGRVVEGHGDLRPEHVSLGTPPVVIDCVEFNREFRLLDPVDELAYLGMECERLGAETLGAKLLARYGMLTGDQPSAAVVDFYKSFRALLRAKLAAWHLDDRTVPYPSQWFNRARAYLALAERYARQP